MNQHWGKSHSFEEKKSFKRSWKHFLFAFFLKYFWFKIISLMIEVDIIKISQTGLSVFVLSFCPSISLILSLYQSIILSLCLSVSRSYCLCFIVFLSLHHFASVSFYLSILLSLYHSIMLSICLSVSRPYCPFFLSFYQCIILSVCLSVCQSYCLSITP